MQPVEVLSRSSIWTELLTTNSTSSSFASTAIVASTPSGDNVIQTEIPNHGVTNTMMFVFYGAGADDATYDSRIWGWQYVDGTSLWVPTLLAELTCTLSTMVGVSGQAITNTDRIVDTYALDTGFNSNVSVEIVSPANNTGGYVVVDVRGFKYVQVDFDMTGATNGNCIYRGL